MSTHQRLTGAARGIGSAQPNAGKSMRAAGPRAFVALLRATWIEFQRDRANYFAVAINYYLVLSLVPMVLLFLSGIGLLLRFSPAAVEIEQGVLLNIEKQLGSQVSQMLTRLLETVTQESVIATIVALATLVISASVVFRHLRMAFRAIWRYEPPLIEGPLRVRVFAILRERIIAFLLVLGGGALLLIGTLLIASVHGLARLLSNVSVLEHTGNLLAALTTLVLAAVGCGALYRALPPLPLRWRDLRPATLLCAVGWVALAELLPVYRAFFAGNESPYSAIGLALPFLLSLNLGCQLLLFGAEMCKVVAGRGADAVGSRTPAAELKA